MDVAIRSYKDPISQLIATGEINSATLRRLHRVAVKRLNMLEITTSLLDLRRYNSLNLEALLGNRKGQFSIRINRRYRICFRWINGDFYDVEIVDYH